MKKQKDVLKLIYSFLLGIVIALFIGIGINTFYPAPKEPEMNIVCDAYKGNATKYDSCIETESKENDAKMKDFNEKNKTWARTSSIFVITAATIFAVIALTFSSSLEIIANGLLLGSIFTLLYGTVLSMISENRITQFVVISVSLAVTLAIGYMRFIREKK